MNHSKYNPQLDPKNIANQPKTIAQTSKAPMSANVPNPADVTVTPDGNAASKPADLKVVQGNFTPGPQASPAPMQAASPPTVNAGEAMINEGGNSVRVDASHPGHQPSALTGGLPELPAARGDGAAGEAAPALQAKPATSGETS
ncbi:MAG TPA: hypothetical protein VKT74_07590 [Gammaproteobacteria bacterium]|nr:hypothetical protein [Gammaproteobacteria bacterium]